MLLNRHNQKSSNPRLRRRHESQRKLRGILNNSEGATAIEFAMLGIPFLALLFGIIELAVVFFISSTTQHALETVSREIRTGEFQSVSGSDTGAAATAFKARICSAMAGLGSCNNLRVDVISSSTGKFTDLSLPVSPPEPTPEQIEENEKPTLPADSYNQTEGGDVVIVRVQYFHSLAVPTELTRLANAPGNIHVITHTTAFRNEPFATEAP